MDYLEIGKQIKALRLKRKMTQENMAEKVNISASHLSDIERGVTKLSLPTLVNIANVLSVSTDSLLCFVVNSPESRATASGIIEDDLMDCTINELKVIREILLTTKHAIRSVYTDNEN